MDKSDISTVYTTLQEAGLEHGLGDFGTYAMGSLRLEKGFRGWGAEVSTGAEVELRTLLRNTEGLVT